MCFVNTDIVYIVVCVVLYVRVTVEEEFGEIADLDSLTAVDTPRYPKRNIARKNYHESSDEDEIDPGNFCFCECKFHTEVHFSLHCLLCINWLLLVELHFSAS